jgi:hypothetical protein
MPTTALPQPERHWYRPPAPTTPPAQPTAQPSAQPSAPVPAPPVPATPGRQVEANPPWWTYVLVVCGLLILWPFVLVVWAVWWILKAVGIVGAAGTVPFWGVFHPASRRAPWWG